MALCKATKSKLLWEESKTRQDKMTTKTQLHECSSNTYACSIHMTTTQRIEEIKGGLQEDSYHWILENFDF